MGEMGSRRRFGSGESERFYFDRIAFGGGTDGAFGPAVFAKEGFEESASALFFAFLNFRAVMGWSADIGDELELLSDVQQKKQTRTQAAPRPLRRGFRIHTAQT